MDKLDAEETAINRTDAVVPSQRLHTLKKPQNISIKTMLDKCKAKLTEYFPKKECERNSTLQIGPVIFFSSQHIQSKDVLSTVNTGSLRLTKRTVKEEQYRENSGIALIRSFPDYYC